MRSAAIKTIHPVPHIRDREDPIKYRPDLASLYHCEDGEIYCLCEKLETCSLPYISTSIQNDTNDRFGTDGEDFKGADLRF